MDEVKSEHQFTSLNQFTIPKDDQLPIGLGAPPVPMQKSNNDLLKFITKAP